MAKKSKKMFLLFLIPVLIFAIASIGYKNSPLYIVGGDCYTLSQAQSYELGEEQLYGYCPSDCQVEKSSYCSTSKPYVVKCVGGTKGSCNTPTIDTELPDECRSDSDCGSCSRCYINDVQNTCGQELQKCPTGSTWDCNARQCLSQDCRSGNPKCSECQTCKVSDYNNIKSPYVCSNLLNCGDSTTQKGGSISSVSYVKTVATTSQFTISGYALPTTTDEYFVKAYVDLKSIQPLTIVASQGAKDYACGGQYMQSGQPTSFEMSLIAPKDVGKYKIIIGLYNSCEDTNAITSKTYDITVTNENSEERNVDAFTGSDNIVTAKAGDSCISDFTKECSDGTQIIPFECSEEGVLVSTDEVCQINEEIANSPNTYIGKDGTVYEKPVLTFKTFFSIDGLKSLYKFHTAEFWAVIIGLITLIIVIFIFVRKNKSGVGI